MSPPFHMVPGEAVPAARRHRRAAPPGQRRCSGRIRCRSGPPACPLGSNTCGVRSARPVADVALIAAAARPRSRATAGRAGVPGGAAGAGTTRSSPSPSGAWEAHACGPDVVAAGPGLLGFRLWLRRFLSSVLVVTPSWAAASSSDIPLRRSSSLSSACAAARSAGEIFGGRIPSGTAAESPIVPSSHAPPGAHPRVSACRRVARHGPGPSHSWSNSQATAAAVAGLTRSRWPWFHLTMKACAFRSRRRARHRAADELVNGVKGAALPLIRRTWT